MSVYGIVSKFGKVQEAPINLRSRYKDVLAFHLLTDEQRKEHGWYPCTVINESYDPINQNRSEPNKTFDGSHVTVQYTITDKPPEQLEAQLAECKRSAIKEIDSSVDTIINNTAGNRTEEYKMALEQATQWKNNNFEGPAPIAVLADTIDGVRTEIEACERIISTALAWTDKLMSMRFTRLQTKAKVNAAIRYEEVTQIMRDFTEEIRQ